MERAPSDTEFPLDAVTPPAAPADDARPSAGNGHENGSGNGHAPSTQSASDDGSSLVTTPATTRRKPRTKKAGATTERPKRAPRKKIIEPPKTPAMAVPVAPLTRP